MTEQPAREIPAVPDRSEPASQLSDQERKPKLGQWFWGTLFLLAGASISLTVLSALHEGTSAGLNLDQKSSGHRAAPVPSFFELSSEKLAATLTAANKQAVKDVATEIGPALDEIYAPVYAAIPAYADFHYSLKGEYLELTEAAMGNLSRRVQEKLFDGFGERLGEMLPVLDSRFEAAFHEQLSVELSEARIDESSAVSIGPLTQAAVDAAKSRALVTAPVASAAAVGGAASAKAAASILAKKLGAKIAVKATAKAGAKSAAAATGAGSGALICSWAGPGAGLCAAGGAVIAWVATDIAVIELDEVFNREEFETNLRQLVDEDRASREAMLEHALAARAAAVQGQSDWVVQDFTIRQLSKADTEAVCSKAAELADRYGHFGGSLRNRNPAAISSFRAELASLGKDMPLRWLAREIDGNIAAHGADLSVSSVRVRGNLPPDYRASKDVSGRLVLNGLAFDLERDSAEADSGFNLSSMTNVKLRNDESVRVRVSLRQHRLLLRDRLFGGRSDFELFGRMQDKTGRRNTISMQVPIMFDEDARSLPEVNSRTQNGSPLTIEVTLRGGSFPGLKFLPDCAK